MRGAAGAGPPAKFALAGLAAIAARLTRGCGVFAWPCGLAGPASPLRPQAAARPRAPPPLPRLTGLVLVLQDLFQAPDPTYSFSTRQVRRDTSYYSLQWRLRMVHRVGRQPRDCTAAHGGTPGAPSHPPRPAAPKSAAAATPAVFRSTRPPGHTLTMKRYCGLALVLALLSLLVGASATCTTGKCRKQHWWWQQAIPGDSRAAAPPRAGCMAVDLTVPSSSPLTATCRLIQA